MTNTNDVHDRCYSVQFKVEGYRMEDVNLCRFLPFLKKYNLIQTSTVIKRGSPKTVERKLYSSFCKYDIQTQVAFLNASIGR